MERKRHKWTNSGGTGKIVFLFHHSPRQMIDTWDHLFKSSHFLSVPSICKASALPNYLSE